MPTNKPAQATMMLNPNKRTNHFGSLPSSRHPNITITVWATTDEITDNINALIQIAIAGFHTGFINIFSKKAAIKTIDPVERVVKCFIYPTLKLRRVVG